MHHSIMWLLFNSTHLLAPLQLWRSCIKSTPV